MIPQIKLDNTNTLSYKKNCKHMSELVIRERKKQVYFKKKILYCIKILPYNRKVHRLIQQV